MGFCHCVGKHMEAVQTVENGSFRKDQVRSVKLCTLTETNTLDSLVTLTGSRVHCTMTRRWSPFGLLHTVQEQSMHLCCAFYCIITILNEPSSCVTLPMNHQWRTIQISICMKHGSDNKTSSLAQDKQWKNAGQLISICLICQCNSYRETHI